MIEVTQGKSCQIYQSFIMLKLVLQFQNVYVFLNVLVIHERKIETFRSER